MHMFKAYLEIHKDHESEKWKCWSLSHVWFLATPWTVARQTPLSMRFSRQEYWSELPFSSPRKLLDPEIKPQVSCITAYFIYIFNAIVLKSSLYWKKVQNKKKAFVFS